MTNEQLREILEHLKLIESGEELPRRDEFEKRATK